MKQILLNCDLGEGFSQDASLMPLIDSCSVACGGHFGDDDTMKQTIDLALQHNVNIGAHPSFPDPTHFGRKPYYLTDIDPILLKDSLTEQILKMKELTEQAGSQLHHIKAHGALYNLIVSDEPIANFFLNLIESLDLNVPIYTTCNARIVSLASQRNEIEFISEAFADRAYQSDGKLVSRNQSNALIQEPIRAWEQVKNIALQERALTIDNQWIDIQAETFCVHGDTEHALSIVEFIRNQINQIT